MTKLKLGEIVPKITVGSTPDSTAQVRIPRQCSFYHSCNCEEKIKEKKHNKTTTNWLKIRNFYAVFLFGKFKE